MESKVIIILFFFNITFSQTKVMFYDASGDNEHDSLVYASFIEGYGSGWNTANEVRIKSTCTILALIDSIIAFDCDIIIVPTSGASLIVEYVNPYYPQFVFIMPVGNTHVQTFSDTIPNGIILVGATDTITKNSNATAYNIEFHVPCIQQLSSYACGKIGGIMARVMDCGNTLNNSRILLRKNRSYTNENGYGIAYFKNSKILIK